MAGGMSYLAYLHHPSIRGRAMSGAMSGVAVGVVAGPPLGTALYQAG